MTPLIKRVVQARARADADRIRALAHAGDPLFARLFAREQRPISLGPRRLNDLREDWS